MNRLGLKIVCLVASIVIWMQVAATSEVEQVAQLPLRIVGLGQGLTVEGSDLPQKVEVRVQGSKLRLLAHKYFNRYLGEVRINLATRPAGPSFSYELDRGDVFTDLTVVNIFPPVRVRLHVDELMTWKLPVRLETDGSLPEGKAFLAPPSVKPDSVTVTGARRFYQPDVVVPTLRVNLDRLKESQDFPLGLVAPGEFLHLARDEVSASFRLAPIMDRTLANIPVIPLVDAGQPEVGVSPPVVDVMVRGVADSVRSLDRSRFLVTVPVGSLAEGVYVLPAQVEYPPWLTLIGLNPSEFQVIVGHPPAAADSSSVPNILPGRDPGRGGGEPLE
jgi:hypothetical protein